MVATLGVATFFIVNRFPDFGAYPNFRIGLYVEKWS